MARPNDLSGRVLERPADVHRLMVNGRCQTRDQFRPQTGERFHCENTISVAISPTISTDTRWSNDLTKTKRKNASLA